MVGQLDGEQRQCCDQKAEEYALAPRAPGFALCLHIGDQHHGADADLTFQLATPEKDRVHQFQ